jgi:hypothetical protein
VIKVKEGTTEAWLKIVGKDALDLVLRESDGSLTKGIDDYRLSDLVKATISGANRPKEPDTLAQVVAVLMMPYDFRKKVATNFEMQQAAAAKVGESRLGWICWYSHCLPNRIRQNNTDGAESTVLLCKPSARSTHMIMSTTMLRCKTS